MMLKLLVKRDLRMNTNAKEIKMATGKHEKMLEILFVEEIH